MNLTLHWKFGNDIRSATFDDTHDVIIGRPGAALPARVRGTATVSTGIHGTVVNDGTVAPLLFDVTPDRRVSRVQARLSYELSTWWAEPLSASNSMFLNSVPLDAKAQLKKGDILRAGESMIAVDFTSTGVEPEAGLIDATISADETQPALSVTEDKRLTTLNRITEVVVRAGSRQSIVDGIIRELGDAFPRSSRRSLLLIEDRELVPRAFWPPDEARLSFTRAREAIQKRQSLHWIRDPKEPVPASLIDVTDALYAPMLVGGEPIGLLHVDSVAPKRVFTDADLQMLTVIAGTAAGVLGNAQAVPIMAGLTPFPAVFLSYAHAQIDFAKRLTAALRRNRVKVWMDERLNTGEEWRLELAQAIANTNALVLLVSRQSASSEWVKWEFDQAQLLGRPVLPVLYERFFLPAWLHKLQYTDASKSFDDAVRELAAQAQKSLRGSQKG